MSHRQDHSVGSAARQAPCDRIPEDSMHWDGYTIFSIVSGAALLLAALSPRQRAGRRAWMLIGGVAFIGYGIFVATRTSGTYYFPIWVFVLPFLLAGRFVMGSIGRSRMRSASSAMPPNPLQQGYMPPPQPGTMPPPQGGYMPPPEQGGMMPPPPAN
jgi:hypothetical protein